MSVYTKTVLLKTPHTEAAEYRGTYLKPTRKTPHCWSAVTALGGGCYEGYWERKYSSGLTQHWTLHSAILTCQAGYGHSHSSGMNVIRVTNN